MEQINSRRQKALEVEKFFAGVEFGQGVRFSKQCPEDAGESFPMTLEVPTDTPVTGPVVDQALKESGEFPPDARVYRGVVFESAEYVAGGLASMLAEMVPETSVIALVALDDADEEEDFDLFAWVIVEIPQR